MYEQIQKLIFKGKFSWPKQKNELTSNQETERLRDWEAELHGFRATGSPSPHNSNIRMRVMSSKNMCQVSEL